MADFSPDDFESEWIATGRSGYGRYEWSGNRRVRRIVGPWANEVDARKSILGHTTVADDGSLTRFSPWRDPDDDNLIAIAADIRGLGYAGQSDIAPGAIRMRTANKWQQLELAVTFAAVRYQLGTLLAADVDPDSLQEDQPTTSETERYCVKRVRRAQDSVSGLVGDFRWPTAQGTAGSPAPLVGVPLVVPITYGYQEVDVTWLAVPASAYPTTAIDDCIRKINDDDLLLPPIPPPAIYPRGSVYLRAVSEEEMYFTDSSLGFHITYHFNVLTGFDGINGDGTTGTGWNYFPAQSPADSWRRLVRNGMTVSQTDSGRYAETDFSQLFEPEPP